MVRLLHVFLPRIRPMVSYDWFFWDPLWRNVRFTSFHEAVEPLHVFVARVAFSFRVARYRVEPFGVSLVPLALLLWCAWGALLR